MTSAEASYNKLLKTIAGNLKRLRKSKGLSQSDMVEYGFDLRYYQRIESGTHSPSLFTLHKLAKAFDCELKELFD